MKIILAAETTFMVYISKSKALILEASLPIVSNRLKIKFIISRYQPSVLFKFMLLMKLKSLQATVAGKRRNVTAKMKTSV